MIISRPVWRRFPDLPAIIQFTDRDDGKIWTLTHNEEEQRIGLTDDPPSGWIAGFVRRFDAYAEPSLPGLPHVRIFVRGGRLGYEVLNSRASNAGRLMSRRGLEKFALELFDAGWRYPGDVLGWKTTEVS